MNGDLQRARDVLAKWRTIGDDHDSERFWSEHPVPLVRGTAGNLDLLDAIDSVLAVTDGLAASTPGMRAFRARAERVAEAIVASDARNS